MSQQPISRLDDPFLNPPRGGEPALLSQNTSPASLNVCAVLHYDTQSDSLVPWLWPIRESGVRVKPHELTTYRSCHVFRGPCCLCAADCGEASYTESAIFIYRTGDYIAACARAICDYWSKLLYLTLNFCN